MRLGRGEEFLVAGGREGEVAEGAAVDADYVGVPEGEIRKVFGGEFLSFAGELFTFGLIHFDADGVGGEAGARLAGLDSIRKTSWFGSRGAREQEERRKAEKRKR